MTNLLNDKLLRVLSYATLFALTSPALAQGSSLLEEVIVTAERRATNIQDIPLTITAFSADKLRDENIQTTVDLQFSTIGFVQSQAAYNGNPYLSGVGSDLLTAALDASVSVYVDGIYQTRNALTVIDLFDVEGVELLKGPQGTLYGRNATGGAILYRTKDPEKEFRFNVNAGYGI